MLKSKMVFIIFCNPILSAVAEYAILNSGMLEAYKGQNESAAVSFPLQNPLEKFLRTKAIGFCHPRLDRGSR
jgi:hypothetical protein